MAGAQPAPVLAPAVLWSGEAVRKLRTLAVDGLMALPHRGMEVGGLLLGSVSERPPYLFSVEDVCPIRCEHRSGPGFTLSETDLDHLRDQLADARANGEHFVIGFFRSHTGPDGRPELDEQDRELIDDYFDDPSHLFLALHPASFHRCEAVIYTWNGDRLTTNGRRFELSGLTQTSAPQEDLLPPVSGFAAKPATPDSTAVEHSADSPRPAAEPQPVFLLETAPPAGRASITPWFVGLICGLALAGFLVVQFRKSTTPPQRPPPVSSASEAGPEAGALPDPAEAPATDSAAESQDQTIARRAEASEKIQPEVPESIRARMTGPVSVTLRVEIDRTGRAVAARPQEYSDGLRRYLAQRAAEAAMSARYRPAESGSGSPLPSTETITVTIDPR